MKLLRFVLPILFLLGGAARSVALSVTFTHIPAAVNSGESYFVRAEGYSNYGVTTTLWKGNQYLNSGDGSPWSAASVWTADAGPATVGFTAEAWDWEWGNVVFDYRTVTVNGGAANQPPIATVEVDGQYNGATVVRPYGGSLAITVRYKATDADGNLSGIRPQVWSPDGNLNNNGGNFVGQSGASGEVAWTVYLNQNGNWYFWTDAQDSVISPSYVDSGAWGSGFRINVIEGAPPPQNPNIWLTQPTGDITVNVGTTVTLQSYAEDFSRPLTTHNLDIQKPDGTWNWYGGFAFGEPYMGGPTGPDAPTASLRTAGFNFNIVGTWQVRSYAANNAGLATHSVTRTVTVLPLAQAAVGVSPASASVTVGQSVAFTASGGSGSGAYVWGGLASGSGSSQTVTFNSAGTHTVTVYRAGDSTYAPSNTATATVTVSLANQSAVSISPTSQTITAGQAVAFTAAGGNGSGAYVWGGDAVGTGTTKSITFNTTGTRTVTVYRQGDSTYNPSNTATATITVNAGQTVAISPASASVTVGQSVAFSASGGGGTGDYVWGGDASGTGASKSVTFNTAGPRTVTVYRQASSGYSQSNTATSTIDVSAAPPATIAQHPQSQTAVTGSTVTFGVSATGTGTLSYQWLKNGNAIVGATGSTLSLANVQTTDSAGYSVVVTHNGTATTSNIAWLPIATAGGTQTASAPGPADRSPVPPGMISTFVGGSGYNIQTGSIYRVVRDFQVTGAVGAYPLNLSRVYAGGAWGYSFIWWAEEIANPQFMQNQGFPPLAEQFLNVRTPDGQFLHFTANNQDYPTEFSQSQNGTRVAVVRESNQRIAAVALHFPDGGSLMMEKAVDTGGGRKFRPVRLVDPFGLATNYSYSSATQEIPTQVTDAGGRYLRFYGTDPVSITRVESSCGKWIEWAGNTLNYWDGLSASYASGTLNSNTRWARFSDVRQTSGMRNVEYILNRFAYGVYGQLDQGEPEVWEVVRERHFSAFADPVDSGTLVSQRTVNARGQTIEEVGFRGTGPAMDVTEARGDGPSRNFRFSIGGENLLSATDFRGNRTSYSDWFNSVPGKVTDALGRDSLVQANNWGRISRITNPDLSYREYTWDDRFLSGERDERGNWTYYDRDARHRIWRIRYSDGSQETFAYNDFNQLTQHTLRNGASEYWEYNAAGLTYRQWQPNFVGAVTTAPYVEYTYYTSGASKDLVLTARDPRGNITTYEYNSRGQVTKETFADGNYRAYTYDNWGNRLTARDELGNITTSTYDAYSRLVSVVDPLNNTISHSYEPMSGGSPLSHASAAIRRTTSPSGRKVAFLYDNDYRVLEEIRGEDANEEARTTMAYDAVGSLTSRTDQVSTGIARTTTYAYDARNRKRFEYGPLGRTTEWQYDAASNIVKVINPDGTFATKTYNSMNQVATATDEMGYTVGYTYTNGGLVNVITDRKGFTYRYEYDPAGRKTKFWYPAANGVGYASWESWTYTPTGQVSEFVNRSGQRLVYTYDNRNRETQRAWDGGVAPTVSTTYDAASRVLTRSNPTGTLTYGYDAVGRLTSESQAVTGGQTVVVAIIYDVDGRRQTRTATGEQDLGYVYDARGQLTSMGSTGMTFGFSYDLAGARTQRTSPNGTATGYLYDGAGRLVTVDSYVVSGFTNILRQDFGRDLRDRRTWSLRDVGYGDSYTYQANGELTGFRFNQWRPDQNPGGTAASADTYAYDPNGNRTTRNENGSVTTYTANALNEYTAVSGSSIAHSDGRGNITQWQAWSYTYDAENRLVLAVSPGLTVGFRYDAQGRLAKLERNGVAEFRYFDGTHRFLRKDAGGGVQERTIWGPSANEALARWTPSDGWHYFHHDPLNSPVAITNTSGLVIERYLYDVFGMDFVFDAAGAPRTTSIVANPWRFTGQEWMADLALHNYKNRFYQNDLGRFIQQDPLRFDAGDFNLYRYCGNDGINHVDPHGLAMSRNPYAIKYSLITTFGSKAEERENSSQQLGADTVEEQAENGPRSPKNAPNNAGGEILFRQPSTGEICIQCHGVSAGGFSGNVNDFKGLSAIPGSGPRAAEGYTVLKNTAIGATAVAGVVVTGSVLAPAPAPSGDWRKTGWIILKTLEAIISFVRDEPRLPTTPIDPTPEIVPWNPPVPPGSPPPPPPPPR
ncbi:MAG: hypothetical protein C0518_07985 [Opitutus sp.]|nr:hypothetical protein [Opitutus sp.]